MKGSYLPQVGWCSFNMFSGPVETGFYYHSNSLHHLFHHIIISSSSSLITPGFCLSSIQKSVFCSRDNNLLFFSASLIFLKHLNIAVFIKQQYTWLQAKTILKKVTFWYLCLLPYSRLFKRKNKLTKCTIFSKIQLHNEL